MTNIIGYMGAPRIDIRAGAALFEQFFSIKYLIFDTANDLFCLEGTKTTVFKDLSSAGGIPTMNEILLTILIISSERVTCTVAHLSHSTCMKGRDELNTWFTTCVAFNSISLGSTAELVTNWNDKNNQIFDLDSSSAEATYFKNSPRA